MACSICRRCRRRRAAWRAIDKLGSYPCTPMRSADQPPGIPQHMHASQTTVGRCQGWQMACETTRPTKPAQCTYRQGRQDSQEGHLDCWIPPCCAPQAKGAPGECPEGRACHHDLPTAPQHGAGAVRAYLDVVESNDGVALTRPSVESNERGLGPPHQEGSTLHACAGRQLHADGTKLVVLAPACMDVPLQTCSCRAGAGLRCA